MKKKVNTSILSILPKWSFIYIFLSTLYPDILSLFMYKMIFSRKKTPASIVVNKKSKDSSKFFQDIDWFSLQNLTPKYLKVSYKNKKLKLYADYLAHHKQSKKTVIVAHGYAMDPRKMSPWIKIFHDRGYNILLPHTRAHGHSEGKTHTMGILESVDYIRWGEELIKEDPSVSIVYFGISMGGATVLMLSGKEFSKNIKGIIADCPYVSVKQQLASEQIYNMVKIAAPHISREKNKAILEKLNKKFKKNFNVSLDEINAKEEVKKSKVPILLIHEKNDNFVPSHMSDEIYDFARNNKKDNVEFYKVPNHDNPSHGTSIAFDYKFYKDVIYKFLDKIEKDK